MKSLVLCRVGHCVARFLGKQYCPFKIAIEYISNLLQASRGAVADCIIMPVKTEEDELSGFGRQVIRDGRRTLGGSYMEHC